MNSRDFQNGARVVVMADHGTVGMWIAQSYVASRRVGAVGTVLSPVGGTGGDLRFVQYDDGSIAVHCFDEVESTDVPKPPRLSTIDGGDGTRIVEL